jgi:putative ABC transport system permease protein
MDTLWQDLRYGARSLLRSRGFTIVAVLTLALGIGANTAIFSLVNGILLRPLPYPHADRLVITPVSLPDFDDLRAASRSFDDLAVWGSNRYSLGSEGAPSEPVLGGIVSARFFPLLGGAALGRVPGPEDQRDKVAVLGHGLWQRRFGGDSAVVGRVIRLYGEPHTVIGVMPPEFQFPAAQFQIWVPLESAMAAAPAQARNRSLRIFRALGRLKPGLSMAEAQVETDAIARRLEAVHPDTNQGFRFALLGAQERLVGPVRPALLALLGMVSLVLLIACANVANLLLVRARAREREIAIRTALGADRWRVVRQLLTESLILAGTGAALGVLLARWALDVLPTLSPDIPRLSTVRVDPWVLAFTAAVAVLTGILFGLAPAWQAVRTSALEGLREGGRGAAGSTGARRLRATLAASEVALALVVLVGAGLLVKSLVRLLTVETGFVADNLLTAHVPLVGAQRTPQQRAALAAQVVDRVGQIPGVAAVGGATGLPPVTPQRSTGFAVEGREPAAEGERAFFIAATPGYFRALRASVVDGRTFDDRDVEGAPEVVLINRTLARRLFGDGPALGRRLRLSGLEQGGQGWRTIVGVVGDVRYAGLDDPGGACIYTPFAQTPFFWTYLMVRTTGPPLSVAGAVRAAVSSVDPLIEVAELAAMEDVIAGSVSRPRFNVVLISSFAALALVLAVVGIYGVISYSAGQRTREIGVRMALGASGGDVLRLVTVEGLRMAAVGVGAGLFAAVALSRLLAPLLFEVAATDAATYAAAGVALLALALLASALPALRASRLAPMTALRTE